MGIDNATAIAVGLPRDQIENKELLDNDEIQAFAPYYDGCSEPYTICGLGVVHAYSSRELDLTLLLQEIESTRKEFTRITGQIGKVYLTLDIS